MTAKEEEKQAKKNIEKINTLIDELQKVTAEIKQMKIDFADFINQEIPKIKSATVRSDTEKRIKQNMSRFELTSELDEYVNSITKQYKNNNKGFSI